MRVSLIYVAVTRERALGAVENTLHRSMARDRFRLSTGFLCARMHLDVCMGSDGEGEQPGN